MRDKALRLNCMVKKASGVYGTSILSSFQEIN